MQPKLENSSQIEKMFKNDSKKMKNIGCGVYKRASRKGFLRGGMKTPYDFMSAKERRNLNGEVTTYMMFEQDINYVKNKDDFMAMDKDDRLDYFKRALAKHKVRGLCQHWKISTATLYNKIMPEIGYKVSKKNSNTEQEFDNSTNSSEKVFVENEKTTTIDNISNSSVLNQSLPMNESHTDAIPNDNQSTVNDDQHIHSNVEFNFKGQYNSKGIEAIYSKLKFLLESGTLYDIEINIKEKQTLS